MAALHPLMIPLREQLAELIKVRFDSNVSAAARVIGVSQPALRGFLQGNYDASIKMLRGCAKLLPDEVALAIGLPQAQRGPELPHLAEAIEILRAAYRDESVVFLRTAGALFQRDVAVGTWIDLARIYDRAHRDSPQSESA